MEPQFYHAVPVRLSYQYRICRGPIAGDSVASNNENTSPQRGGAKVSSEDPTLKKFLLGVLLASFAVCANAGTVAVFGSSPFGFDLSEISNFYISNGNTASVIGTLDSTTLAGVNLLWAFQRPSYTAGEITAMQTFLASGGRITFVGEHGGETLFADIENNAINSALGSLGSTMSIIDDIRDSFFHNALRSSGQILNQPLTTGVNTFNYAAFAPLNVGAHGAPLILGTDFVSVMMSYETVGNGTIFLVADQNGWDNIAEANDNDVMFLNFLNAPVPPSSGVPEPSTFVIVASGLAFVLFKKKSRA
jgi:hypothetical protein